MSPHQFAEALRTRRLYGTLIASPSPHWIVATRDLPLDFVFLDTEHLPMDRLWLAWMCRGYTAAGLPVIVRIPTPDPHWASMVVDGGASGVLAPYVERPEQVRALVGAVKFRPLKGDRLRTRLEESTPLETQLEHYLRQRNQGLAVLVNIESVPALKALDEILAVEGLDGVIVGPHDLSCSLGIPEQYEHPQFVQAVDQVIQAARRRGLGAGVHAIWKNLDLEIRWAQLGANILLHSADFLLFRDRLLDDLQQLRNALGDSTAETTSHPVV